MRSAEIHSTAARERGMRSKPISSFVEQDEFLASIGDRYPSHRFLANSTQIVYIRYVEELSRWLRARHQRPEEEIRVLDWGCGKGQITYLLAKRGFNVTSCDVEGDREDSSFGQATPIIDELNVSVIRLRHESELPFADGSFDCVVSFGVLEHVPSDSASLQEIRRVLRPGGILFITFLPYFLSWTQALGRLCGQTFHDRLYSQRGIRELAGASRFAVESLGFGQLFPKNSVPRRLAKVLEPLDRALCRRTPMRYFATNLAVVLKAV